MIPILSKSEVKAREQAVFASLPAKTRATMGAAGLALARRLTGFERILVVCGAGNNGGDGLACAYLLAAAGKKADVVLFGDPERMSEQTRYFYEKARPLLKEKPGLTYGAVVDAVVGIGARPPLTGEAEKAVRLVRSFEKKAYIIAADVPSGLDADSGEGDSVRANETVTMGAVKPGLLKAKDRAGKVTFADAGLDFDSDRELLTLEDAAALLPEKDPRAHKGDRGFVGVIGGARGMEGACLLSATAALAAGAGRVSLCVSPECRPFYDGRAAEVMLACQPLGEFLPGKTVMVFGPGFGRTDEKAVERVLAETRVPLVIDADGLYFLTREQLKNANAPVILTPHIGEAMRLTGLSAEEIKADPFACAREYARDTGAIVALKDHYTVVSDGKKCVAVDLGHPVAGTAGSGDVLSGTVAASVARTHDAFRGALLGVALHGLAAKNVGRTRSAAPAGELAENLGNALFVLENAKSVAFSAQTHYNKDEK